MVFFSHQRSPAQSLREYGRGLAGGLMFSLPMLFTMEVWMAAFVLHPLRIAFYVIGTFAILLLYNRFIGLRRDASLTEVAIDSIEEMGLGILLAALILWLTGTIDATMTIAEVAGKVILEAMTVAIGVSIGTAQLGGPDPGDDGLDGDQGNEEVRAYLPQVAIALCGAVLFAANAAATLEIKVIALRLDPMRLLLLGLFSIGLIALILHFAEFRGASTHTSSDTRLDQFRGIVTTYAISLCASGGLLWFFGNLDDNPFHLQMSQTVIVAVPAVLGASAGRFLLQTESK